jgi:hypothetical protein
MKPSPLADYNEKPTETKVLRIQVAATLEH